MNITLGNKLTVNRLGFGAMRITGEGIWGEPEPTRGGHRRPAPRRRARRQPHRHRRLLRPGGQRGADRRGAAPVSRRPRDRHQGRPARAPARAQWPPDGRPEHLQRGCEGSLRRLRLERIDLYQLHTPDPKVRYEESVGALKELQDEGKIRHVGVSNVDRDAARARPARSSTSCRSRTATTSTDRRSEDVLEACDGDGHRLHPLVPARGGQARRAGRPARRDRRARTTPRRRQIALAWLLAPLAGDAADPRHRLGRAPRGERRRRRRSSCPRTSWPRFLESALRAARRVRAAVSLARVPSPAPHIRPRGRRRDGARRLRPQGAAAGFRVGEHAPVPDRGAGGRGPEAPRPDRGRGRSRGARPGRRPQGIPGAPARALLPRPRRPLRVASRAAATPRRACAWPPSTRSIEGDGAVVVVASAAALAEKVPDPELRPHGFTIEKGGLIDLDEAADQLVACGYERVDQVEDRGQFAIRGDILDVYPATEERAVRCRAVRRRGRAAHVLLDLHPALARGGGAGRDRARGRARPPSTASWPRSPRRGGGASAPTSPRCCRSTASATCSSLVPDDALVAVAAEEELEPALADYWQDVTTSFHDADAHHLYVAPEQLEAALARARRAACRASPGTSRTSSAPRAPTPPPGRCRRPSPSSRSWCARATGRWWPGRVTARRERAALQPRAG